MNFWTFEKDSDYSQTLECPEQNKDAVEKRLREILENSVNALGINIKMKCDTVIEHRWGEDAISAEVQEVYVKAIESGDSSEIAMDKVYNEYPNFPKESIDNYLSGKEERLIFQKNVDQN